MSEQGIRAFRPFGRHFWLVVAAALTLAAGAAVALVASTENASAQGLGQCPAGTQKLESTGTVNIDGVNVTVTISGDTATVTADAAFTGEIYLFTAAELFGPFAVNLSGPDDSQSFSTPTGQDISHVCIGGQAAPPPTTDTTTTETETTETTITETTPGERGVETVVEEQEVPGEVAGEEVVAGAAPGAAAAAPAGEAAPSQLAFTGLSAVPLALLAGGMLALGLGLRRASRRAG